MFTCGVKPESHWTANLNINVIMPLIGTFSAVVSLFAFFP